MHSLRYAEQESRVAETRKLRSTAHGLLSSKFPICMGLGWAERMVVHGPPGPPCSSSPAAGAAVLREQEGRKGPARGGGNSSRAQASKEGASGRRARRRERQSGAWWMAVAARFRRLYRAHLSLIDDGPKVNIPQKWSVLYKVGKGKE